MNESSISMTVATEILSILVCMILGYGNVKETRHKTAYAGYYSLMLFTDIIGTGCDALSWILEGKARWQNVTYVCTLLSVVLTFILIGQFMLYIYAYVRQGKPVSRGMMRFFMVSSSFLAAATLVLCITGKIFYYENGVYKLGPLYDIYTATNVIALVISIAFVAINSKRLGRHDSAAAYLYIAIPAVTAAISIFVDNWSYEYPASALSLLVLYVMIQSEQRSRLEKEQEITQYTLTHDELTAVYSRTAYTDVVDALVKQQGDAAVGVVFCDVNGLKYTNDHFGHREGDRLLTRFAQTLCSVWQSESVYRISGDEFVVLVQNAAEDTFYKHVEQLQKLMLAEEMASFGVEFGSGKRIHTLLQMAEEKMYAMKNAFHRTHPQMQR